MKKLLLSICACFLALGFSVQNPEAAPIGGAQSIGITRQATPAPKQPPQAAPQPAPQAAPAGPAAQPKRNWRVPLAGLAAGIGLAALLDVYKRQTIPSASCASASRPRN